MMTIPKSDLFWATMLLTAVLVAACGGDGSGGAGGGSGGGGVGGSGGGSTGSPQSYIVGGTVSGLSGAGLVLQDNGGDDLAVSTTGSFAFTTALAGGAGYNVTVKIQPANPSQTCAVSNASGTIGSGNVANVTVTCTTNTFTIGGTVLGLSGSGLVLQDNGGDLVRPTAPMTPAAPRDSIGLGASRPIRRAMCMYQIHSTAPFVRSLPPGW